MNNLSKQSIIELKEQGLSSRFIAGILNVSKSTVNDTYNRYIKESGKVARLLFLDVETSPDVAVTFRRFKANIGLENILKEGGVLLSVSWRKGIDGVTEGIRLTSTEAKKLDDSRLIAKIHDLMEESDIFVAHNGDNFDFPQIKTRAVINGFPPFKRVRMIDTLKLAKTMRFQSNRLEALAKTLGLGSKASTGGIKLWIDCMEGDETALETMLEYNKQDVNLLVEVYLKLRAFANTHPNLALYQESEGHACRICGSTDVESTGNVITTPQSVFEEYKCNDCGARQRSKVVLNTQEQRKNLLL